MTHTIVAVVTIVFTSPDGVFPAPEEFGVVIADAANKALVAYADGGWSIMYAKPATPPPPPPARRWRVVFGPASLRGAPSTTAPRLGYAAAGDVLTEIETQPDWVHTERGWILARQVEPVTTGTS